MDTVNQDVKTEPDCHMVSYNTSQEISPSQQCIPHTEPAIDFITFRSNVERTSQMLDDTWIQLNTILNSYKSQLLNVDASKLQKPDLDDMMKQATSKERENEELREEMRLMKEQYTQQLLDKDRQIQLLQFEVMTEKNQRESSTLSSSEKIHRLESRIHSLEEKLDKNSRSLVKSQKEVERWTGRPSGRLMPATRLVQRTPTPTQVARVTPVPTLDKYTDPAPPRIKTETESLADSASTLDHADVYMTQTTVTVDDAADAGVHGCGDQKFVVNTIESHHVHGTTYGGGGGENLPSWSGYESNQNVVPMSTEVSDSLFLCPHCTQSFTNEKALNHHLRASHRKFTCPKCYEHYARKYDLLNHIGLVHGKRRKDSAT